MAAKVAGHDVLVGSPRFLAERGVALTMLDERTQTLEAQGRTVITVARNGKLLGLLAFGDAPRPDAAETIRKLRSEEHTSELQSLMRISYAVFCLKKKTTKNKESISHRHW